MSAKHTPGPWAYAYDGSSTWSIGEADDPQDKLVASIGDRDDARATANARLIAAAPDLLKALEFCAQAIRTAGLDTVKGGICAQAFAEARAAIAKARGGE